MGYFLRNGAISLMILCLSASKGFSQEQVFDDTGVVYPYGPQAMNAQEEKAYLNEFDEYYKNKTPKEI